MTGFSRTRSALAICGILAICASAARAEVVLSAYGGLQSALHSTLNTSFIGSSDVHWKGRPFQLPLYYGFRAVWWRDAVWGVGVDYTHSKIYADHPQNYGYSHLEFTDGLNILTATVWRRWQTESRITPYVSAGLGISVPHTEITPIGYLATSEYQFGGPAAQIVAGASYKLNDRWSVFTEYKGVYSRNKGDLRGGGNYETNVFTNAIDFGLGYQF